MTSHLAELVRGVWFVFLEAQPGALEPSRITRVAAYMCQLPWIRIYWPYESCFTSSPDILPPLLRASLCFVSFLGVSKDTRSEV